MALKKVLYGEAPPRDPNPYPSIYLYEVLKVLTRSKYWSRTSMNIQHGKKLPGNQNEMYTHKLETLSLTAANISKH